MSYQLNNANGWKLPIKAATTGALAANTYANGTLGVGATLTANANGALASIDGYSPAAGDRLLIQNEATAANNGIYVVTQLGDAGTPYILTRAQDCNCVENILIGNIGVVINGTVGGSTLFQLNSVVNTVGTDALTFVQNTKLPAAFLKVANNLSDVSSKSSSFDNLSPMSASGDMIYGGASGTGTRLPKGTDGQFLGLTSGTPTWQAATATPSFAESTKTTTYSITTSDNTIFCDATSAAFTVTLPTAVSNTNIYFIKKVDTTLNPVTIATTSSQTIDAGPTSIKLPIVGSSVMLQSNGSNWMILSSENGRSVDLSSVITPTNYGTTSNVSIYGTKRGDRLYVLGTFKIGTPANSPPYLALGTNFVVDTAKLSSTTSVQRVGKATNLESAITTINAANDFQDFMYDGSTNNQLFQCYRTQTFAYVKDNASAFLNNNVVVTFDLDIPISGWI